MKSRLGNEWRRGAVEVIDCVGGGLWRETGAFILPRDRDYWANILLCFESPGPL